MTPYPIVGIIDASELPITKCIETAYKNDKFKAWAAANRGSLLKGISDAKGIKPALIGTEPAKNALLQLSVDQVAAIYLYTMESPIYMIVNEAMRARDVSSITPFLPYLRLILSGLYTLPLLSKTVYRGVRKDLSGMYSKGMEIMWWQITSTTGNIENLSNKMFLGTTSDRTKFTISALSVIDISVFSSMDEDEHLILPCTIFQVDGIIDLGNGLHEVQLTELPILESFIDFRHPELDSVYQSKIAISGIGLNIIHLFIVYLTRN